MSHKKIADKPENTNGYVWVYLPDHPKSMSNGYVYEHRLVVERYIGRFLKDTEQVQHKDGNAHNNIISNLTLWIDDPQQGLIQENLTEKEREKSIPEVLRKDYKIRKQRREEEKRSKESSLSFRVIKAYLAKGSNA